MNFYTPAPTSPSRKSSEQMKKQRCMNIIGLTLLEALVAVSVVRLALLGIGQDLMRLGDVFELAWV